MSDWVFYALATQKPAYNAFMNFLKINKINKLSTIKYPFLGSSSLIFLKLLKNYYVWYRGRTIGCASMRKISKNAKNKILFFENISKKIKLENFSKNFPKRTTLP